MMISSCRMALLHLAVLSGQVRSSAKGFPVDRQLAKIPTLLNFAHVPIAARLCITKVCMPAHAPSETERNDIPAVFIVSCIFFSVMLYIVLTTDNSLFIG